MISRTVKALEILAGRAYVWAEHFVPCVSLWGGSDESWGDWKGQWLVYLKAYSAFGLERST